MKKRLPIIIIAVLVVVFAGLGFYSHQKSKIKYNTSYVNGNTAGNLYNAGLFCEKNGTVYFANPDDDYRLYSMDTNGNHLKKLSYDRVMYINADDHYVYYVRNNENNGTGFDFFSYARNSLCRIDQNGENTKILDKIPACMPRLSETTFIICTMMTRMLQRFTRSESMAKDAKKYIRLTFLHAARWVSIFIPAERKVMAPSISWIPPMTA